MKKKLVSCFVVLLVILTIKSNCSYAHKTTNIYKQIGPAIERTKWGEGEGNKEEEAEMLEQLKVFGYNGEIKDEIMWETTITIKLDKMGYNDYSGSYNSDPTIKHNRHATGEYWDVLFNEGVVENDVKFDDLRVTYACEHHKPTDDEIKNMINKSNSNDIEVYTYKAVIIAKKDLSNLPTSTTETGEPIPGLRYFITAVYTGIDMEEGKQVKLSEENTEIAAISGKAEAELPNPKDYLFELLGKAGMKILDFICSIPDAIQRGINSTYQVERIEAQTYNAEPDEITYKYETIEADASKNKRADVSKEKDKETSADKKIVSVDGKDMDENAEIPVIPVDMYNMLYGKIDLFDINFFTVDKTKHPSDGKWMFIRGIFVGILRAIIYICSGFLIMVLILYSIGVVKQTVLPNEKKKMLDGLKRFVISLVMLIVTVLIMNLCIYATEALANVYGIGAAEDGFLRINVNGENNYSFSVNFTEFVRYMTQIGSVDKLGDKVMYVILYIVLVVANIFTFLIMFVRSIAIVFLSMLGPIVAAAYAIDQKVFNLTFQSWIIKYLKWVMVQVVLMIIYNVLIQLTVLI